MKNLALFAGALLTVVGLSCSRSVDTSKVAFDTQWRFQAGDDPAWASPELDDTKWDSIDPLSIWEEQGYNKVDGFGWYRVKVLIPSTLKSSSFFKDSLQIDLGRIDDCDQVFLNGQLIGENGRSLAVGSVPSVDFFKERGHWDVPRGYRLTTNDPRIKWDGENTFAIRVYDQGGAGGIFSGPFAIAMTGLKERVKFDLANGAFTMQGDSVIEKKIILKNHTAKEEFKGELKVEVVRTDNHDRIFQLTYPILLTPSAQQEFPLSFKMDFRRATVMKIAFHEVNSGETICGEIPLPYLQTPATPAIPKINGAKVFGVRPNAPFLFKVAATGEAPLRYTAVDLPEGLNINELTGLITGSLKKRGEYMVMLKVENALGMAERVLRIVVGDMISLTPPMGWNSWNCWGLSVSDRKVRESAEQMVTSGLIDHGWSYINIDDGWEDTHDDQGKILPNTKFPNMWGLCNYVHAMGLKIGIYSSPGPKTCGGYEGSYGFEEKDAQAYANWGFDYLKYDWCSYWNIAPNPTLEQMKRPYLEMERALKRTGRDIHYSLCQYGMGEVWKWGAEVNGNSWRTTGDITDTWESLSSIGFSQNTCSPYAAPGRWNDPDMLVVGWVGWGPHLHYTRLTPDEQYTHLTLWSLLAAPLLIGCDLKQLDPFTLNLLTNDEVLAVNQDPLGLQATQIKKNEAYEIWARDLEDGSKAIGLFNKTEKPINIQVIMADLLLEGKYRIRDLWRQYDLGWVKSQFEMRCPPHGARMITLSQSDPLED